MVGDELELTRRFAAGPATFAIRCSSTELKLAVEALFGDLEDGSPADTCTEITLATATDGMLEFHAEEGGGSGPQRADHVMSSLVTAVSRLALDSDPDHLHLHCAALSFHGRGVLISAGSGVGKTTLAAALARRTGWMYVSDEAVALKPGSTIAAGFPKPLVIKPGGGHLVPELESARVDLGSGERFWWQVPTSELPAAVGFDLEPWLIVILHRSSDGSVEGPPSAMPMHPADVTAELMRQTMDAQRFGSAAALGVLADLATRCRGVSLSVGPLDIAASVIEELIQSEQLSRECRLLERPPNGGVGAWRIVDSVHSLLVGERVVAHEVAGGAIVAFDEAGSAVWRSLHGCPPDWWLPESINDPNTTAFLDQLAAHGLLRRVIAKASK